MEKFWEKAFSYVEKVVSPYQVWLIILLVSGGLIFCPEWLQTELSLQKIIGEYRGYAVIVFFVSAIVIIFKTAGALISLIGSYERVDASNLNDEERAILCFFVKHQFQGASLNERHPSVVSLRSRNFITVPRAPILFLVVDDFEYFILTKAAKRRLSSIKFQREVFDVLSEERVLTFINSISRDQYSSHSPQVLR
jgi:hypothetical protein